MAVNSLGGEVVGPLGLIGNVPAPSIETRTEEQLFQDVTTPTGLKPIQPDAATSTPPDPFAGFQDASFDDFQDAPDEFADFKTADDLDLKSVEELDKARDTFNPAEYLSNNPDVAKDLQKFPKLLEVARRRYDEGLTAKGVAEAAIKQTPGLVADIAGGVKRLGERAIDLTVQPIVNVLGSVATGDIFDDQKRKAFFAEAKRNIKKSSSEVGAGSEAATVGLVDLGRTGLRKMGSAPGIQVAGGIEGLGIGQIGEKFEAPKPLTDQEVLQRLTDDSAFRQSADAAMRGEGEATKAVGLDKETLAKQGIEIDEKAIGQLSLVDPITMIAAGGAFKLVGLGGKVLGTARTLAGAEQLAEKLTKVASVSRTSKIVGGAVEKVGKLAADARRLQGRGFTAAALMSGGIDAGLLARAATKAVDVIALPTVKKVGKTVEQAGKIVAGKPLLDVSRAAAEGSAGAQRLAGLITGGVKTAEAAGAGAKVLVEGAGKGIVAGSPFALAADSDEQAGALLGVGAALGAGGAAGAGAFRVVKNSAARRYFGDNRPVLEDVASPAYGKDATLDTQHDANVKKLSSQDASELNNFREALRAKGGEIYAVDAPTFRQKMTEIFPDITPELLDTYSNHSAFFDAKLGDRKVVYLNSDTKGLQHDAGHIFDAILSPEKRAELRQAVTDTFGQKSIDDFKATYEQKVGSKISDVAALDEYVAEQFSALFNNVPVTELNAPKSLLNKFIDTVAEGAESLGIDLSAGATTPSLGAPVSVGIRKLFQNAAGEVTRKNVEGKPTAGPEVPPPSPETPPTAPAVDWATPRTKNIPPPEPASTPIRPSGTELTPESREIAAKRFSETGIEAARKQAKSDPVIAKAVEDVSVHMEAGNPVLEIDHLGVKSKGTPDSPEGRTSRRATQAAGYEALKTELSRAGAPSDLVASHLKTFVPVRWEKQGGTPTLIAMSLDKALRNIQKLGSDPKAASLIPYPTKDGNLTPQGWRDAVSDLRAYAENQANGRRGDGGRLTVPEAGELSIPAENPAYTPQPLTPEKANFANVVQGLLTPDTARAQKGKTPGNIKGQLLAEANKRAIALPAKIPPKKAGKQAFVDFSPRVVKEVNPLRNRLKEAGVDVKELLEVTERIRAIDIEKVTPRPDISFKAPVTDVIRGGFLPVGEYWMDSDGKMIRAPKGHDKAAKEILADTFKGSDVYSEMFKRGYTRIISSKEGLYVDSNKTSFSDLSSAQKTGIEDAVLSGGPNEPIELTFNGKRFGGGGGGFLPAPTEFRQKSLGGKTVEEFAKYVLEAPVEEWRAAIENMTGGQTGGSWNLGLGLKDRGDLAVLKKYQDAASAKSVALMDKIKSIGVANATESMFTEMQTTGTKAMFFREALEAAQGIGSAGAAFAKDRMGFGVARPPFPIEAVTTTESTSAGGAGTTTTESSKTP